MKVRAIKRERAELPDEVKMHVQGDGAFVTIGKEYEVHCILFSDGVAAMQIVDDIEFPAWYPIVLFEVTDRTLPEDRQCQIYPNTEVHGGAVMMIGPEFIVRDAASAQAMCELEADQVDRFWKRVDRISSKSASSA